MSSFPNKYYYLANMNDI